MNKDFTYQFGFAGVNISLKTEWLIHVKDNFRPFLTQPNDEISDGIFEYRTCDTLDKIQGKLLYQTLEYDVIMQADGNIARVFKDHRERDAIYAYSKLPKSESEIHISVLKGNEYHFDNTNNSFFHTGWEQFLIQRDRLILHASLIETQFGGLIFSGPSGIGKSTQAGLWEEYEDARQINGDRPILYKKENVWMGYGSPYAGSSKCYVNRGVPIRAILILAQGSECNIVPLRRSEAFREIFKNCTVYNWNQDFLERVITLVTEIITDIPIYRLMCTPDQRSVETVKELLKKESEL